MNIHFEIPGKFVAWQRAGISSGRIYTQKKTRDWQKIVAYHARKAMSGFPPLIGPVAMSCHFYYQIPESWAAKKKQQAIELEIYPTGRPDLSNLVKSIEDACNGIVYIDDAQICRLEVTKNYSHEWATSVAVVQIV